MSQKDHWQRVYSSKPANRLGWYAPHLQTSFRWIRALGLAMDAPIVDVGGGASTLVDDLLDAGYRSISVLDLSEQALSFAKARLGKEAVSVSWLRGDVTEIELPSRHFQLWHDRAVFHFLIEPKQQRKYREKLLGALRPGGNLIIGTFGPEAPPQCSGLPVQRYSRERLESALGPQLQLERHCEELHVTPSGVEQMYLYCQFRRAA